MCCVIARHRVPLGARCVANTKFRFSASALPGAGKLRFRFGGDRQLLLRKGHSLGADFGPMR
jgi:hypothetical protein